MDRRDFLIAGALAAPAAVLGGRLPRAWAGGREPLALVTADHEAHVVAISLVDGRIRKRIRTRADPRAIESHGAGPVVVAHSAEGVISLLDPTDLRVRRVLGGFSQPRYTAIAPDGTLAYVTDSGTGELAVVDLVAGRVVRRVEVGAGARHATIAPDGGALWIALGSSAAEIVVVDAREPRRPVVRRRLRLPFLAHDVAFSPSGQRVWVTAGREPRIAVCAADGSRRPLLLDADAAPQHVAFGARRAYVASGNGRSLQVRRLSDGAVLATAAVPYGSYNVTIGAQRVVTPSLGTGAATVLDERGRVRRRVRAAGAAHDACIVA